MERNEKWWTFSGSNKKRRGLMIKLYIPPFEQQKYKLYRSSSPDSLLI
jgi:hypothetical protein